MGRAEPPSLDPAPFDVAWLASRRWFRSKSRPLGEVAIHDAARLGGDGWLLVMAANFVDGGVARYLVPAVGSPGSWREPPDGAGAWRRLVVRMVDAHPSIETTRGSFTFQATDAMSDLLPGGADEASRLEERRLGVEQSNTSVRLGDRLMLKLYRLLEPGINPEVELMAFLGEAGFRHAPRLGGSVGYRSAGEDLSAAAILQSLVPSRGDAWSWMLEHLAGPPHGPVEALAAVAQIGGITAGLHATLGSRPELPGFPARLATTDELAGWRSAAERQLEAALRALRADDRKRLERVVPAIRATFDQIPAAGPTAISRIHGDYHLGQLLATDDGFVVIDFEGEPARALAERRSPASPLRDVAGMLRSLDYAARTAERSAGDDGFEAEEWLRDARAALLAAYGGAGETPLLGAMELEKACYEIGYEANYRPDWVWLPLQAVERLVARP
jgi:maltose alpha-D-glucosyltransferase/alpha-amylase